MVNDGELLLVLLLLGHHLLSLDLGDILVNHLLRKLRLVWITRTSDRDALGTQFLLKGHDLGVHFEGESAELCASDFVGLGLDRGLRSFRLTTGGHVVPILRVFFIV